MIVIVFIFRVVLAWSMIVIVFIFILVVAFRRYYLLFNDVMYYLYDVTYH